MSYKKEALKYLSQGFIPLPERHNSKIPAVKGWNTIQITKDFIDSHPYDNLALRMSNNLIAIDVDTTDTALQDKIRKLLPKNAPEKVGNRGFTLFFTPQQPMNSENFKLNGELIIELLSKNRKTSIGTHPSTEKPYQWVKPLLGTNPPELTIRHLEALREAFPKPIYKTPNHQIEGSINYTPDIKEIERALTFIDSTSRDTWIAVGRSLYSFDSNAFQIFDTWSSSASTYKPTNTLNVWKSFNGTNSTTISTLFWHARQSGFTQEAPVDDLPYLNRHFPMFDNIKRGDTLKASYEFTPPPSLILDIQEWITDTNHVRQPILSLSAAIASVGMLLAHKIQSPTGVRSNVYTVSIAYSGGGKERPRTCISALMRYAEMSNCLNETPTAGTSIIDGLTRGKSKTIFQPDEFGKFYASISGIGKKVHESEIKRVILAAFSKANSSIQGRTFSSGSTGKIIPPVEIFQPCLCIHGSTTHDEFFDALGSGDTVDGFLNRFLMLISEIIEPEEQEILVNNIIPSNITNKIDNILVKYPKEFEPDYIPQVLPYSAEARIILDEFSVKVKKNRRESIEKKDRTTEAWVRCREIAIKLALICSAGKDEITTEAMEWACGLSYWNSQQLVDIAQNKISDSEFHSNSNKVKNYIKSGVVSRKVLINQRFSKAMGGVKILDAVLYDLIEGGTILVKNQEGEPLMGNQTPYYSFIK